MHISSLYDPHQSHVYTYKKFNFIINANMKCVFLLVFFRSKLVCILHANCEKCHFATKEALFYTTKHGQKCQNGWSVKANFIHFIRVFTSKVQSGLRPNPLKTRKNTYETCIRHLTNRLELWALYVFYRIDRAWGHYALPGANRNFLGRDTGFPHFRRDCGDHEKQKQKWAPNC